MKKSILLVLIPTLFTTGCFSSSISEDKMKQVVSDIETNIDNGNFTNVHIRDKLQYQFDYKEGSFYRYHNFALLILVPITDTEATWEENGKYYHYEYNSMTKKTIDEEIDKAAFDTYMVKHKASIAAQLMAPVNASKKLLGTYDYGEIPVNKYEDIQGASYKLNSFEKKYTQKGTGIYYVDMYEDGVEKRVEKQDKHTIVYKNSLPIEWTTKNDGESKWKYSYGKAEFTNPKQKTE